MVEGIIVWLIANFVFFGCVFTARLFAD